MADLIPAPRPVPTREDRMRDARNDRTFATYLDRSERDQLDARAATAEAERDDALNDRDAYREARNVLRAQLDRLQPLIAAATTWRTWYGNTNPSYASACNDLAAAIDALPPSSVPPQRAQEPEREEVRWAYRWIGPDGQVYDEMDTNDNAIETGEQRAHRIAAKRLTGTVRGEVLRYRVLTMPAEVVATYPPEARP